MNQLSKEEVLKKMVDEMPYYLPSYFLPYIKEAMELYANQNKWVSVKERLPEAFEYVLVDLGGNIFKGRRYSNGWAVFFSDGEKNIKDDKRTVTHWQPLPNPAK